MTDTLPDGAPVLEPETPPHLPEMELEVTGVFADGRFVIGIKTDEVEFNLSTTHAGFDQLDFLLAALPPAVDQVVERIAEEIERRVAEADAAGEEADGE